MILFKGEIDEGQELETVKKRLAQLFKTSPERIEKLFTGKPITLNQNIDYAKAQEYSDELKNAGALCIIEPMPTMPSVSINKSHEAPSAHSISKIDSTSKTKIISSKNIESIKAIELPSSHSKSISCCMDISSIWNDSASIAIYLSHSFHIIHILTVILKTIFHFSILIHYLSVFYFISFQSSLEFCLLLHLC